VCREFLVGGGRRGYDYAPSSSDPRWSPYFAEEELPWLSQGERERRAKERGDFVFQHPSHEPSMDEICGLVASHFIVGHLAPGDEAGKEAREQATMVADYLANFGYLLVRPGGGFTARGASGALPAFEYVFNRAFLALTGKQFPARADFEQACRKAGMWKALEPHVKARRREAAAAIGIAAVLGLFGGPFAALAAIFGTTVGIGLLFGTSTPLAPNALATIAAIYERQQVFDVSNKEATGEFAAAAALLELDPLRRMILWFDGSARFASGDGGQHSGNFPPFLGLMALDDPDTSTRDAYLDWFHTP
jgi:hypothetical protein